MNFVSAPIFPFLHLGPTGVAYKNLSTYDCKAYNLRGSLAVAYGQLIGLGAFGLTFIYLLSRIICMSCCFATLAGHQLHMSFSIGSHLSHACRRCMSTSSHDKAHLLGRSRAQSYAQVRTLNI